MQTVIITKLVLTGALKGLTVQDTFQSEIKPSIIIGNVYKGFTFKYKVISIEYRNA